MDRKHNISILCDIRNYPGHGCCSWYFLLNKAFERYNYNIFFVLKQQGIVLYNITSCNEKANSDSDMDCYGVIIKYQDKLFMFYNGYYYGRSVSGLAEAHV